MCFAVSASRPASCASITSVFALNADQATEQTESASTVEDTAKLAIMAKSKAVEDQVSCQSGPALCYLYYLR